MHCGCVIWSCEAKGYGPYRSAQPDRQRWPHSAALARVVGGMITSAMLILFFLPAMYRLVSWQAERLAVAHAP
jgi:hypothetical protein